MRVYCEIKSLGIRPKTKMQQKNRKNEWIEFGGKLVFHES
jgi:hypothetical protein